MNNDDKIRKGEMLKEVREGDRQELESVTQSNGKEKEEEKTVKEEEEESEVVVAAAAA